MKLFIAALFTTVSLAANAETLAQMKTKANAHLGEKLSTIETARTCVNSAESVEAFKACKYDMHEDMKIQKQEMIEEKTEQKEEEKL